MKTEYIRNLNASHMVVEQKDELKTWERKMVRHNHVEGIIFGESTSDNGVLQLWYDITGKQALEVLLETEKLDYELLYRILSGICNAAQKLESLLLETGDLLLSPEAIFIDYRSGQVNLCYYPGNEEGLKEAFRKLMEYLLTKLDHKDENAVKLAYDLYEETQTEGYSLFSIIQRVRMPYPKEETEIIETADYFSQQEAVSDSSSLPAIENIRPAVCKKIFDFVTEKLKKLLIKKTPYKQEKKESFVFQPETEERNPVHPTVLLSEITKKTEGILKYEGEKRREDFVLDKFPYFIGSDTSCEGCIPSETVSRKHARITKEEDIYFIEDLNSSNGTSVSGELLNYRVKMSLKKNDIIFFADEKFRFI